MIGHTNEQWERIRKHFPEEEDILDGRLGRKPIPTRHVLEAVLWILSRVRNGTCCRKAIRTTKLFIDAFKLGAATKFCAKRGKGMKIMAIGDRHGLPLPSQHAFGEPSRSPFGTAMFRLLHGRSQAEKLIGETAIRRMRSCETTALK
jgi:hypothetical protein